MTAGSLSSELENLQALYNKLREGGLDLYYVSGGVVYLIILLIFVVFIILQILSKYLERYLKLERERQEKEEEKLNRWSLKRIVDIYKNGILSEDYRNSFEYKSAVERSKRSD